MARVNSSFPRSALPAGHKEGNTMMSPLHSAQASPSSAAVIGLDVDGIPGSAPIFSGATDVRPVPRQRFDVMGCRIDRVSPSEAVERISAWAERRESRYVCMCNAHVTVTTNHDAAFHAALAQADMVAPDGAPVAWMLRRLGATGQKRVSGPDLMLDYCEHAAATGQSIFLYGTTDQTLEALQQRLLARWPTLRIAGALAPPFRPLTAEEDAAVVKYINDSGAQTVWVSLGCPKQELWMAAHRGRVKAVMLGVGAAFTFHSGLGRRAPRWMQERGLEWLHRLATEPRRLWRRYLSTNLAFVVGVARQSLRGFGQGKRH